MKLNPYLFFNNECEAAFKFYEQYLGGKIASMHDDLRKVAHGRANTPYPLKSSIKSYLSY
jgi:uncharacterized glyoxalase superfamily protein PhnB